jgi:hypothetical protein
MVATHTQCGYTAATSNGALFKNDTEETQIHITMSKKPVWESHMLTDSDCRMFCKRWNCGDSDQSPCWTIERGEQTEPKGFGGQWNHPMWSCDGGSCLCLSKTTECAAPKANPNVNHRLQVIMTCQCVSSFVTSGGGWPWQGRLCACGAHLYCPVNFSVSLKLL